MWRARRQVATPLRVVVSRRLEQTKSSDQRCIGIEQHIGEKVANKNAISRFFPLSDEAEHQAHSTRPSRTPNDHPCGGWTSTQRNRILEFFMPSGYPRTVTPDYWPVQRYWNIQWATSSALQVFATQSLLTSVGIGTGAALPLSATANWVLKVRTPPLARRQMPNS